MAEERAQRRLAAVLAADVVAYSRLMGVSEVGTLAALKAHRRELVDGRIAEHRGRIVKLTGDGMLVEFSSVVNAVTCAVEIQCGMAERNAGVPEGQRIEFRIGVNLGDIIFEDDDIFGDGVNIAARIESIAKPGGVAVSGSVRDSVANRLDLPFEDMGEQTLKNIDRPVRVYEISLGALLPGAGPALQHQEGPPAKERPSIAVLPFNNMSGDPEQEYFADGITEDIITDLSRWRSLAVSSRNSTFRFKGKSVDIQRVGRELGARFLVEGSVRRMGERIRITAQLIDVETGNHLWAERFDRAMADLFAVQDEVVRTIVGTLVGRVYASDAERARRKPPSSLVAYDHVLRGNALPWDDPASAAEAKRAFERAIEIDPEYGVPHSLLAAILRREWASDFSGSHEFLDRAFALAQRGVELAENESLCHGNLGVICLDRQSFDLALRHIERSLEINPVNQWNRAQLGVLLSHIGRAEEGLEILRNVRRVDPYFGPPWYWHSLGIVQFVLRRYADALVDFDRAAANSPRWILAMMAGCCAKLGLTDRARELVARCLVGDPGVTIDKLVAKIPFKRTGDSDHLAECLRWAGLPE